MFSNTSYANRPPEPRGYALFGFGGGLRITVKPIEDRFGIYVQGSAGGAKITDDVLLLRLSERPGAGALLGRSARARVVPGRPAHGAGSPRRSEELPVHLGPRPRRRAGAGVDRRHVAALRVLIASSSRCARTGRQRGNAARDRRGVNGALSRDFGDSRRWHAGCSLGSRPRQGALKMQIRLISSATAAPLTFAVLSLVAPSTLRRSAAPGDRPGGVFAPAGCRAATTRDPGTTGPAGDPRGARRELRGRHHRGPRDPRRRPDHHRALHLPGHRAWRLAHRLARGRPRVPHRRPRGWWGHRPGFNIRKLERLPKNLTSESKVSASVRMAPGQPVVVAAVDRADGSRTEVLAELK